jgi:hypothetical protein
MTTPITIDFGNRQRTLRFDIEAQLALEGQLGKTTREIMADLAMLSFSALLVCLWAGLKHEDRALTVQLTLKYLKTYEQLPGANVQLLFECVMKALQHSQWYQQVTSYDAEEDAPAGNAPAG